MHAAGTVRRECSSRTVEQYNLSAAVAGSSAATTKGMSILAAGFCNQASYMRRRAPGFFAAQIARD
jgi:hypothetical protein